MHRLANADYEHSTCGDNRAIHHRGSCNYRRGSHDNR
jgi:hypothetical protein